MTFGHVDPKIKFSYRRGSEFPQRNEACIRSHRIRCGFRGSRRGLSDTMVSPENTDWLVDYGFDETPVIEAAFVNPAPEINWNLQGLSNGTRNLSVEMEGSFEASDVPKESGSKKRVRSDSCSGTSSKACREKLRRDRLNDKFIELGSILEPGRPPKTDKAAILVDAVRMVTQLRSDAQKLKESNLSLQEKIKELKVEKNELRDEKQRLKLEKETLEQQLKVMNAQPAYVPQPAPIPTAFATQAAAAFAAQGQAAAAAYAAQGQAASGKLVPFVGYPGVAMWQFMPPAAVDTSQDHVLRPPVA
uniref:BHLH domain-containing protein n=1 Tax=Kalanchoe fedtschenkoi TaxID=63787 RepID=A0A7N0TYT9_KALFE